MFLKIVTLAEGVSVGLFLAVYYVFLGIVLQERTYFIAELHKTDLHACSNF